MGEEILELADKWQHWKYKNTALLIISLILFFFFAEHPLIKNTIAFIGNFGYLGAFFVGIMFVSIFTVAPAGVMLFYMADTLNPLGVALAAGAGGVVGDYLILKYLKDKVFYELKPVFMNHGGKPLRKLFKTPYFAWSVPIVGAIIIMSPFPDEVGLGLLGISKMKQWQLLGMLFLLDVAGIFLIVIAARSF
jgi:hypothetical protein